MLIESGSSCGSELIFLDPGSIKVPCLLRFLTLSEVGGGPKGASMRGDKKKLSALAEPSAADMLGYQFPPVAGDSAPGSTSPRRNEVARPISIILSFCWRTSIVIVANVPWTGHGLVPRLRQGGGVEAATLCGLFCTPTITSLLPMKSRIIGALPIRLLFATRRKFHMKEDLRRSTTGSV